MRVFLFCFKLLILLIFIVPLSHAKTLYEKRYQSTIPVILKFEGEYALFINYTDNGHFIGMGMIDHDHNIVIPPIYKSLSLPDKGKIIADTENDKGERMIGILDLQNNWLAKPQRLDMMIGFREDMAIVKLNDKYGYANSEGKIVVPIVYNQAEGFRSGKAAVKMGEKWGFVDKTGKLIIKPKFDFVGDFDGNTGIVCRYTKGEDKVIDRCTLIDEKGHLKIPYIYNNIDYFICGVARTRTPEGRYGFLDKNGKVLVPMIYQNVSHQYFERENPWDNYQADCRYLEVYLHQFNSIKINNPVYQP